MKTTLIAFLILSLIYTSSCANNQERSDLQNDIENSLEEVSKDMIGKIKPEINYQLKPGEIIACGNLDAEGFSLFLSELNQETLFSYCSVVNVYRISESDEEYIEMQQLFPTSKKGSTKSGLYRIGSWPVYTEFIDFICNNEKLEYVLLDHSIKANIESVTLFTHGINIVSDNQSAVAAPGTYPKMCVWLHTDNGDYFLEHNHYLADGPLDVNFTYDFYDLVSYREKLNK